MKNNSAARSIYVIGALFFVFGFVTWINSVLIPFLKQICELTDFQAYFVTFAFYISDFVMAIPSSWVLRRSGFVRGMSYGLLAMAVGSILFIPAALDRSYALFLLGLFLQGTGLALLQTASNPYVTILGPIESAAQRISIMGVCNKIAGMTGIFLLSRFLFSDIEGISAKIAGLTGADKIAELHVLAEKIIVPYVCITVVLILLALVIRFAAKLPEIDVESNCEEAGHERRSLLDYPYFWLGAVSLFLYVGAEVVAIDTLPLYGESQGLSGDVATKLGICSLVATTIGYLIGIVLVPKYVPQRKAFIACLTLALLFLAGALLTSGITSIVFIVLMSFAHSLMWPSLWPLAIENLGKYTQLASAILIMGIAGGAIMPMLYGAWADAIGNRHLPYLILAPGYLFMIYFAVRGYKVGRSLPK